MVWVSMRNLSLMLVILGWGTHVQTTKPSPYAAPAYPIPSSIPLANKIVIFGIMLPVNVMCASRNSKCAARGMGRVAVMNVMQNSKALIEGGFNRIFN